MSRELDGLIALRVFGNDPMGYVVEPGFCGLRPGVKMIEACSAQPFSTDPAAAWRVVEKMSSTTKEHWEIHYFSSGCSARFSYEGGRDLPWVVGDHEALENSMPEAICAVALAATSSAPPGEPSASTPPGPCSPPRSPLS
jgi:hypothetical protein